MNYKIRWSLQCGLCSSVTLSSQCRPVRWSTVRPGVKVEQRHTVNTTPCNHFPCYKRSCPGKRVRASEIPFTFQYWLFCLLFCLNSLLLALHPLESEHPTVMKVKISISAWGCELMPPTQSQSGTEPFLWTPSLLVHDRNKTNWATGTEAFVFAFFANPHRYQNRLVPGQHFYHKYAEWRHTK